MQTPCFSSIVRGSALTLALITLAGCATLESSYDSLIGDDTAPKVALKSPAAAPVQGVKANELEEASKQIAQMEKDEQPGSEQAVELGSMGDGGAADAPFEAAAASAKPVPQAAATAAPVQPPVAAVPAAAPTAAPVSSAALNNALLTIRFNQPHVYYDDALTTAVKQAEAARPGVIYEVLSSLPDLSVLPADQQQKLSARAKDNLRNVVVKIQQLGVPASRVRIAEQTLRIRSQEVQLFVR